MDSDSDSEYYNSDDDETVLEDNSREVFSTIVNQSDSKRYVVPENEFITRPIISDLEFSNLVSKLAPLIESGVVKPDVPNTTGDIYKIAKAVILQKKCPFLIERSYTHGGKIYVEHRDPNKMILNKPTNV